MMDGSGTAHLTTTPTFSFSVQSVQIRVLIPQPFVTMIRTRTAQSKNGRAMGRCRLVWFQCFFTRPALS